MLTVVYKGKPTHHLVVPEETTGHLAVNKRAYGAVTTLPQLVALLSTPPLPAGWPVALDKPVYPPGAAPPATAPVAAAAAADWTTVHAAMTRAQAEALLTAEQPPVDGRFLMRRHHDEPHAIVLSVMCDARNRRLPGFGGPNPPRPPTAQLQGQAHTAHVCARCA